jgi:ribosome biogenesis SPOUT family RNA methylase Rps3
METETSRTRHTLIVEHLDPELEEWQALEYQCIASECAASNTGFLLSGLPSAAAVAKQLSLPSRNLTEQSVESLFPGDERKRVCLLDPKGEKDLSPEDGERFDVFLFGGILGDDPPRGMSRLWTWTINDGNFGLISSM